MQSNTLINIYAVTNRQPDLKALKRDNFDLSFIYFKEMYAVIGRVPEDEYGEIYLKNNLNNMEWLEKNIVMHEKIIETVMKETSLIPFKFATLFQSEESLKNMLNEYATTFKKSLKELDGREEWGVKIYCNIENLKKKLSKDDKELDEINRELSSSSPGKAFFLKKKKEDLMRKTVNKRIYEYGNNCFQILSRQSLQTVVNKTLLNELCEISDEMILNTAFLLEREHAVEFKREVEKLIREADGFTIACTGPWPPYHFCTLPS